VARGFAKPRSSSPKSPPKPGRTICAATRRSA
jgi:hypothetical protein